MDIYLFLCQPVNLVVMSWGLCLKTWTKHIKQNVSIVLDDS